MLKTFLSGWLNRRVTLFSSIFILAVGLIGCSPVQETKIASETDTSTQSEINNSTQNEASDFKVTLLGTGDPIPNPDRMGASTLVEVGGEKLLFDAGRGAAVRLYQSGVLPGDIHQLFLTHLHSDHIVGIPDVLLTGWLPILGQRSTPFSVSGPKGTEEMMSHIRKAFSEDIDARIDYAKEHQLSSVADPNGVKVIGNDINEGVVYEQNDIKVTSFIVPHDIDPSYGYRIDYKGRSVVISGDTTYSENLIEHAMGADVIIHEVAAAPRDKLESSKELQLIMSKHTSPEDAGKVFSQTKPKLAVYTHLVLLGGLTEENADLIESTKKTYSGKVVVGKDLMSINIGPEKVEVE